MNFLFESMYVFFRKFWKLKWNQDTLMIIGLGCILYNVLEERINKENVNCVPLIFYQIVENSDIIYECRPCKVFLPSDHRQSLWCKLNILLSEKT